MNTVAYIHSYPGAASTLAMLWPGFKLLGLPLIGVDCEDEPTVWPEPIPVIAVGINAYATEDPHNLPCRLVLTLKHFLSTEYEQCVVVEYDTLIVKPFPGYPPGFVAHRAGGKHPQSEASQFFHTPWIFDRAAAATCVLVGAEIIADGTLLRGGRGVHASPDMFLGLIVDRCGLPWTESGTFSRNTIDSPEHVDAAREAIARGTWMLHGIKNRAQLESVNPDLGVRSSGEQHWRAV